MAINKQLMKWNPTITPSTVVGAALRKLLDLSARTLMLMTPSRAIKNRIRCHHVCHAGGKVQDRTEKSFHGPSTRRIGFRIIMSANASGFAAAERYTRVSTSAKPSLN